MMGKDDPKVLYIAAYNDPDAASGDFKALKELVHEGAIFIDEAVLVRRDDDGKVHVQENAHEVAGGTMVGAAAGFVIGLIFPPGLIAAAVVGGGAGAGAGGLISRHREHEIKKDIEDVLPVGSSGIVTVFDITLKPKVDKALSKASKVDEEEVDPESVEKAKEEAGKS
jgi:uncharacterized membrane protein